MRRRSLNTHYSIVANYGAKFCEEELPIEEKFLAGGDRHLMKHVEHIMETHKVKLVPHNSNSCLRVVGKRREDVKTAVRKLRVLFQNLKERLFIRKKTFTKWCNSYLNRARLEIEDLFTEVGDGVLLMKLLEIISGENLGPPNRGRMRVKKIGNLDKVLDFLKKKKIQLGKICPEDILEKNEHSILGLIWTIIRRFQIDTIVIKDEEERGERCHSKDALLLWCQRKTAGYPNVQVQNFTTSWRNGLAFNALIHAHRPDLVNFDGLNPNDHIGNLCNAFGIAQKKLGIARLLDADDVDMQLPDEKSIISHVSLFYHYFAKMTKANNVGELATSETMEDDFENISSDLLQYIKETIVQLNSRRFPNSLDSMTEKNGEFNVFRTVEKPSKYKEKKELGALFFRIQRKRKAMERAPYVPPNGLLLHDIETAWKELDHAENSRQLAIMAELQRQHRLDEMANRFYQEAKLEETWLVSAHSDVEQMEHGRTATEVEQAVKKQQSISTVILAREERFKLLSSLCADLNKENFHGSDQIKATERDIIDRWTQLLSFLKQRRRALMSLNDLMTLLRNIDTLASELKYIEPVVRNRDVGKNHLGVEDLLRKHELVEAQVNEKGAWLSNVTNGSNVYIRNKGQEYDVLQKKLDDVTSQYHNLVDLCRSRRLALQKARELFQFVQDHGEEMAWLEEKEQLCKRALANGNVAAVHQTTQLFKKVETEMQSHWALSKDLMAAGEKLIQSGQSKEGIRRRIQAIQKTWEGLRTVVKALGQWLDEARPAQQDFQATPPAVLPQAATVHAAGGRTTPSQPPPAVAAKAKSVSPTREPTTAMSPVQRTNSNVTPSTVSSVTPSPALPPSLAAPLPDRMVFERSPDTKLSFVAKNPNAVKIAIKSNSLPHGKIRDVVFILPTKLGPNTVDFYYGGQKVKEISYEIQRPNVWFEVKRKRYNTKSADLPELRDYLRKFDMDIPEAGKLALKLRVAECVEKVEPIVNWLKSNKFL